MTGVKGQSVTIPFQTGEQDTLGTKAPGRAHSCSNCGSDAPKIVLTRLDGDAYPLVSAQLGQADKPGRIGPCTAERLLCPACGIIETVLDRPSVLLDLQARVARTGAGSKDEIVIIEGKAHGKRSLIEPRFLDHVSAMGRVTGEFLDISCGAGHLTRRIAHTFQDWRAIGIDTAADLTEDWPPINGRPGFLRASFDPMLFAGRDFDVVAAHDVFHNAAPLAQLKKIRAVCAAEALVSLELTVLESDQTAPHFWDRSFLVTRPRFLAFLREAGFDVLESHDFIAGWHVIARAGEPQAPLGATQDELEDVRSLFAGHGSWWERAAMKARDAEAVAKTSGQALAVYGTGPYSAVLCDLVPDLRPTMFIDDAKAGTPHLGRPVLTVDEAKDRPLTVLVAAGPAQAEAIVSRLRAGGLNPVNLAVN